MCDCRQHKWLVLHMTAFSMLYGIFISLNLTCAGVPSPKQRYDILLAHLSEMEHSLLEMQIQHLATTTHGFVGADLAALCNEAALICLRRNIGVKKSSDDSDSNMTSIVLDGCYDSTTGASDCLKDDLDSAASSITYLSFSPKMQNAIDIRVNGACAADECILKVRFEDFEKAKMKVRPSDMREVCLTDPSFRHLFDRISPFFFWLEGGRNLAIHDSIWFIFCGRLVLTKVPGFQKGSSCFLTWFRTFF